MPRRRRTLVAAFAALAACAGAAGAQTARPQAGGPPPAPAPAWREIGRSATIAVFVDTARLVRLPHSAGDVWFRFLYATPTKFGRDTTHLFRAAEIHEEVDCAGRRARDLGGRLQNVNGSFVRLPAGTGGWLTFDKHPLGPFVFAAACRLLGHPMSARGR